MNRKYDLILKQTTDGAYLVQPFQGPGYRSEFWASKRKADLIDTRYDRLGTVMARVGVFSIAKQYAEALGLTEDDFSKEATIHELGSNQ